VKTTSVAMDVVYDMLYRAMWVVLAVAVGGAVLLTARQKGTSPEESVGRKRRRPKKSSSGAKKSAPPAVESKEEPPLAAKAHVSAEAAFGVGDRVEALWNGRSWHPGTVSGVRPLGAGNFSYAVDYDDGEAETRIEPERLRKTVNAKAEANEAKKTDQPVAEEENNPPEAAPDLDACVAYRKDGLPAVPVEGDVVVSTRQQRLLRKKPNKAPPTVDDQDDDDDDDDFAIAVVQTESEWRAAAPKPRKPKIDKKKPAAASPPSSSTRSTTEKNRKKREKQRAHDLAVREAMRNA